MYFRSLKKMTLHRSPAAANKSNKLTLDTHVSPNPFFDSEWKNIKIKAKWKQPNVSNVFFLSI